VTGLAMPDLATGSDLRKAMAALTIAVGLMLTVAVAVTLAGAVGIFIAIARP
jgi:hypothetical protein